MGDEDRMREAADKGFPGHFRLDDRQSLPYCAEDGEDWPCPPVAALGSLLRAVADQAREDRVDMRPGKLGCALRGHLASPRIRLPGARPVVE